MTRIPETIAAESDSEETLEDIIEKQSELGIVKDSQMRAEEILNRAERPMEIEMYHDSMAALDDFPLYSEENRLNPTVPLGYVPEVLPTLKGTVSPSTSTMS